MFNDARDLIRGNVRMALVGLNDHGEDSATFMAGLVAQLKADLNALQREFNLPDIVAGDEAELEWVNET